MVLKLLGSSFNAKSISLRFALYSHLLFLFSLVDVVYMVLTEVKTAGAEPELIISGIQLRTAQCSGALQAPVDPTVDTGITSKYRQDTVRNPE